VGVKRVLLVEKRCLGCEECLEACKRENGIALNYVVWVKKFYPVQLHCAHCTDAPCQRVCPESAIKMNKHGAMIIDDSLCINCGYCVLACPFGIPKLGTDGKIMKCNLCSDRLDDGDLPACVAACPTGALVYQEYEEYGEARRARTALRVLEAGEVI